MFLYFFFIECSPILIPFDFLPEVSQFFLDKDLYFWISFIIVSVIVLSRLNKEMKEDLNFLVSQESESTKIASFVLLLLFFSGIHVSLGFGLKPNPSIAYCDVGNAFTPPPSPVQLPEEPVTPPEEPPVPQPVVIPQLAQPLISDDTRRSLLYNRYLLLNFGGNDDLRHMLSIIDAQVIVERYVEAALIDDGFNSHSILSRYTNIRGILHSPQGRLLSQHTYDSYVTQIREHGTRESVPYRRIMRAIQNYDLFLER